MITVITGAGVSVSAGIPTYRAQNAVWKDEKFEQYSNAKSYGNHLDYLKPRWLNIAEKMNEAEPTLFHQFVAEQGWNVITQNIDGLHKKAGSENVIEIHGSMSKWRKLKSPPQDTFSVNKVQQENGRIFAELSQKNGEMKEVERIRPDVVLFGEKLRQAEEALNWIKWSDKVIYAGTSGNVFPVADWYVYAQGETILVDPVSWGNFNKFYEMTADDWARDFQGF